jgi:hypothetical protein
MVYMYIFISVLTRTFMYIQAKIYFWLAVCTKNSQDIQQVPITDCPKVRHNSYV